MRARQRENTNGVLAGGRESFRVESAKPVGRRNRIAESQTGESKTPFSAVHCSRPKRGSLAFFFVFFFFSSVLFFFFFYFRFLLRTRIRRSSSGRERRCYAVPWYDFIENLPCLKIIEYFLSLRGDCEQLMFSVSCMSDILTCINLTAGSHSENVRNVMTFNLGQWHHCINNYRRFAIK